MGIFLTLALPRLAKLVRHFYDLAARFNTRGPERLWPGLADRYDTRDTIEHTISEHFAESLHSVRLVSQKIRLGSTHFSWHYAAAAAKSFVKAFLLLVVYAGIFTAGVAVVKLQMDNLAISDHPDSGLYTPSNLADIARTTIPYEFSIEADSAKYALDCYDDNKGQTAPQCNVFAQPRLQFAEFHDQDCPFDDSMCYLGPNTAYRMITSPIPASAIGINTKRRLEFKREAVFTPLNMNDTYIVIEKQGSIWVVSYRYGLHVGGGPDSTSNLTWKTFSHGDFVGKDSTYSVG
jgi:hypothetical protein